MEILKTSTDWAKAEVFSSLCFIFFGILFIAISIGMWQLGKTEIARAYIVPALVAGAFILTVGLGLFFINKSRPQRFEVSYKYDAKNFVESEIARTEQSIGEYKTIVFKVIPLIITIAALVTIFVNKPIWVAISITTIVMMSIIMMIDSNANARLKEYNQQLLLAREQL